jgi:hypothetical protein
MQWEAWVLVALYVFSALGSVACIGKSRNPMTPAAAVFALCRDALLGWLVLRLAGVA